MVTDYPDQDLIENLEHNIKNCEPAQGRKAEIFAEVRSSTRSFYPS